METFKKFIIWELATRDSIDVKRIYIDIAGDLVTGVLLSQIIFWFLPNRANKLKLRVLKQGRYWLCKERKDWWGECRITEHQFDRSIKILCKKGITLKKTFKFGGTPKIHISVDFDRLNEFLIEFYAAKKEALDAELGLVGLLEGTMVEAAAPKKKDYLIELRGYKLDLYTLVKEAYAELGKSNPVTDISSDMKLKEYLFEHFWNLYNRKLRKPYCWRQFKVLKFNEILKVFSNVVAYKAKTKFPLAAHNYLRDRAFNDEIIEVPKEDEKKNGSIDHMFDRTIVNIDKDTPDYFGKFSNP